MIFCVHEIVIMGDFLYTVNPAEFDFKLTFSRTDVIVLLFSSLFVLVGDYFYLSLSLSPRNEEPSQNTTHYTSAPFFLEGHFDFRELTLQNHRMPVAP